MRRIRSLIDDEAGSAPVEFALVGVLLTVLTLAALQLGLAIHVRNVVHDAAVEGAFHAALADTTLPQGAERTRLIIARTVGDAYASDIDVDDLPAEGQVIVTVRTTLPLVGLLGAPRALEVSARAPVESLD